MPCLWWRPYMRSALLLAAATLLCVSQNGCATALVVDALIERPVPTQKVE